MGGKRALRVAKSGGGSGGGESKRGERTAAMAKMAAGKLGGGSRVKRARHRISVISRQ